MELQNGWNYKMDGEIKGPKMQKELIKYIEENKEKHYRMAYSYVRNQEDALDLVQDTIVKALKHVGSIKHKEYLGTWFCRILMNTCKTHLKKKNRCIYIDEIEEMAVVTQDKEQVLDMEDAMRKLTPNERNILLLRYYEDLEFKEVAQITSQNISTVKSTLYRTMKKLKKLLE